MTDDREPFREAREAGLRARHEQRLENATYTAAEVKVLTETATKVALELGRREAQGECAAMLEERASALRGTGTGSAAILLGMAKSIRSIASQSAPDATSGRTDPKEGA